MAIRIDCAFHQNPQKTAQLHSPFLVFSGLISALNNYRMGYAKLDVL